MYPYRGYTYVTSLHIGKPEKEAVDFPIYGIKTTRCTLPSAGSHDLNPVQNRHVVSFPPRFSISIYCNHIFFVVT
jgi:hypothetical protein